MMPVRPRQSAGLCLNLLLIFMLGLKALTNLQAQSVPVGGSGEAGIWNLWKAHLAATPGDAQQIESLKAFVNRRPPDPFSPVAQTLAAWHLLRAGQVEGAIALLEPLAANTATDPVIRGARDIARGWLTCLDREQVVNALNQYRLHEVRFPERLPDLENWPYLTSTPPMQDRWGYRWEYRTERLRTMPALTAQRYTLNSRMLGDATDFHTALALEYAGRITLVPIQVRYTSGRPPMVPLLPEGAPASTAPALIMVGSSHEGITVAQVSNSLIILHDRLHWKITTTPKR